MPVTKLLLSMPTNIIILPIDKALVILPNYNNGIE